MTLLLPSTDELHEIASRESEDGYLSFLDHVVVDAQPVKRPFRDIAEPWQWERAWRSCAAIDQLAGVCGGYTGPLSFWEEYHKGSDKTHEDARELLFLLGWSRRPLNCYVTAGSETQAALITLAMEGIVRDNPWIGSRVRVSTLGADGRNGSTLSILPKNAHTGQGIFPDFLIASEVTHWMHEDGRRLWEFVLESVNKRPQCVLKVETNAGMRATWQWSERERIRRSPFWSFYSAPVGKPLPTWMNQKKIDDDSQGLTAGERDRLYRNRWVDPGEELGYLTCEEALLCRDYSLTERTHGNRDHEYTLVLDYGGVHDRAALACMHAVDGADEAVVDRLDCWQGSHDKRVAIDFDPLSSDERSVEAWLVLMLQNFQVRRIVADPHQLEGLLIKYERRGYPVVRFDFRGGKNNTLMTHVLKQAVQNRKVRWSPWCGLLPEQYVDRGRTLTIEDRTIEQEIGFLVTRQTQWGRPRFDHTAGRHDDRACVVSMGLLHVLPDAMPDTERGPQSVGRVTHDPLFAKKPRPEPQPGEPHEQSPPDPARDSVYRHGIMGLNSGDDDPWQGF